MCLFFKSIYPNFSRAKAASHLNSGPSVSTQSEGHLLIKFDKSSDLFLSNKIVLSFNNSPVSLLKELPVAIGLSLIVIRLTK